MGRLSRIPPAAAVFALAFVVYAASAYPSFAPRDSADLAHAAITLGVAHPPGYPLYALLGRLWLAVMPFGDAAWRLNLLSALAGALAASLLARACERHGRAAAWAGGLAFAFCAPLWKFSLLEEMYSLHAAFIAGLLLLADGERRTFTRRAALTGLLFGLGCVNHQSLVLSAPAWLWLWRGEARRHGLTLGSALRAAIPFSAGGLLLDLWVPLRLHDLGLGLAVLSRAEYGTLTLTGSLARPIFQVAGPLLGYFMAGVSSASSWATALASLAGLRALRGSPRFGAVLLGLGASAAFVLLSRLDPSSWLSRTVLETAFLAPAFWLCAAAAAGVAALERLRPALALPAALALGACALAVNLPDASHRDDFSAVDYARSLRRTLPPGAAAVVRGDTALFSLKLTAPDRSAVSDLEPDLGPRMAALAAEGRPLFAVGLPIEELGSVKSLCADGAAVARDRADCGDRWPLYAIRMGGALTRRESYARDPALSYAAAHAAAEKLAKTDAEAASAWDPEDFRIRLLSGDERR